MGWIAFLGLIQIGFIIWGIVAIVKEQRTQSQSLEKIARLLERNQNAK